MNTLLGEIATLNDIQYPLYRVAFKFRKLQKTFLLDHIDAPTLQESLHQSSIHDLGQRQSVPLSQLRSFVTELYSSLKVLKPSLGAAKLQQAQELFYNWCQMVYLTSTGGEIGSGSLKILLCMLSGAKPFDKARIIFSILGNHGGTVEASGISFFCEATQQMGSSVQEQLYSKWPSVDVIFHDCLTSVRPPEDIEDEEELDGVVRRPWLSQFEFTKLFTASPAPKFLGWLALLHKLPSIETVVHPMRCCVCTRKPIVSLRYQCTQCPNFNLCQMCFLKGRTTDKHIDSHQVLEFSTGSKGHKSWRQRLMGSRHHEGRLWTDEKEPFVFSPRVSQTSLASSENDVDSAVNSITQMLNNTQQTNQGKGLTSAPRTHQPAMIRISSDESPSKGSPTKPTSQLVNGISARKSSKNAPRKDPALRSSVSTSSGGSPDSLSSGGGKFNYDGSSASSELAWQRSSLGNLSSSTGSDVHSSPTHVVGGEPEPGVRRRSRNSSGGSSELGEINRRLSMEVDQLLSELPPPSSQPPLKLNGGTGGGGLRKLQLQEKSLQGQVTNLSGQRTRLSNELDDLVSQLQQMQVGGTNSLTRNNPYLIPIHTRSDSAPMDPYHRVGSTSPPSLRTHTPTEGHGSMSKLNGSQHLLDPLVDFTADQLNGYQKNHVVSPEDNRLSVAW